jgi:fibronectin type 3 domain-containing protein
MLSWQSPVTAPGEAVASYNVYRSVSPGGPYVQIASGVNRLTYTDYIVNNGKTYYYVVTSVGGNGRESTYSIEAPAKIP